MEPWEPPKGPWAGGECFAPFTLKSPSTESHLAFTASLKASSLIFMQNDVITRHHGIYPSAGLRAQHFNGHALKTQPSLIPKVSYSIPSPRSDGGILSTTRLNALFAINSFAPKWPAISPATIITLRAEASERKQRELCESLWAALAGKLPLRRYYSSSSSPYGACSTSHYSSSWSIHTGLALRVITFRAEVSIQDLLYE